MPSSCPEVNIDIDTYLAMRMQTWALNERKGSFSELDRATVHLGRRFMSRPDGLGLRYRIFVFCHEIAGAGAMGRS